VYTVSSRHELWYAGTNKIPSSHCFRLLQSFANCRPLFSYPNCTARCLEFHLLVILSHELLIISHPADMHMLLHYYICPQSALFNQLMIDYQWFSTEFAKRSLLLGFYNPEYIKPGYNLRQLLEWQLKTVLTSAANLVTARASSSIWLPTWCALLYRTC